MFQMMGLRMRESHELQCQEATQIYSQNRVMLPRPKLSPRLPLASLRSVHRPKTQAFYLLSKACSRALSLLAFTLIVITNYKRVHC